MYLEAESPVKKMQQFYNVVHPCLLNISNLDDAISTVISHPELHYLMGVTNWIFKLVNKILGTNKFGELEDWCQHRGITIHNYQGGGLDDNNSKKFLKKCNDLDQLLPDTAAKKVGQQICWPDLPARTAGKPCWQVLAGKPGWQNLFDWPAIRVPFSNRNAFSKTRNSVY